MARLNGDGDSFETRFKFGQDRIPQIKQICGQYILRTAPPVLDQREATDLIVLNYRPGAIAARVRTRSCLEPYGFDITLRLTGGFSAVSEYAKLRAGFADMYFYAFAADDDNPRAGFARWYLIDLHRWRAVMNNPAQAAKIISEERRNPGDGKNFLCQNLRTFPADAGIFIAHSLPSFPYYPRAATQGGFFE